VADPQLLVGLGNPGPNYAQTRHNLGFMVADRLAARLGSNFKVHKRSGAEIVTGRLGGRPVVLAKPRCYMNESGRQVGPLAKFYSVPAADILVIHDDLDHPFGRLRIRKSGSSAGNHGIDSLIGSFGTKDFTRFRVGIGRPPGDGVDYVLSPFTADEQTELPAIIRHTADAVLFTVEHGVDRAMTEFNRTS